jgi:hypothetical protein
METATDRRSVYRRTDDICPKAIEDIHDYAIFMTDRDGNITNWNTGAVGRISNTSVKTSGAR